MLVNPISLVSIIALSGGKSRKFLGISHHNTARYEPSIHFSQPLHNPHADKTPFLKVENIWNFQPSEFLCFLFVLSHNVIMCEMCPSHDII